MSTQFLGKSVRKHQSPKERTRLQQNLYKWFISEQRDLPWRKTRDPYAILVSEFMLQQTQVVTVINYYQRWMERFPTIHDLAKASEYDVLSIWQGLGYYARARNLRKTAQIVVEQFKGQLPKDIATLTSLPGLGTYTAAAIACFAYEQRVPVVDANIARVLARLVNYTQPIDTAKGRAFLNQQAKALLPGKKDSWLHNSALMELGARICVARKPLCEACPIRLDCYAKIPETIPVKRPRRAAEKATDDCVFYKTAKGVGLQRVEEGRWAGLWRLPPYSAVFAGSKPSYTEDYGILHYRVRLSVYAAKLLKSDGVAFFSKIKLKDLPIPSPHRRAIEYLIRKRGEKGS